MRLTTNTAGDCHLQTVHRITGIPALRPQSPCVLALQKKGAPCPQRGKGNCVRGEVHNHPVIRIVSHQRIVSNRSMVTFRASNSSIFRSLQATFSPCQPIIGPWWHSLQRATQVYWRCCLMWWASDGPGSSQTEHGSSLTAAR